MIVEEGVLIDGEYYDAMLVQLNDFNCFSYCTLGRTVGFDIGAKTCPYTNLCMAHKNKYGESVYFVKRGMKRSHTKKK